MRANFPNGISCDCEGHFATDYSNSSDAKIIPYTLSSLYYTATVEKGAKNASIKIRYNTKSNDWANRVWKNYKGFTIKILSNTSTNVSNNVSNTVNFTIYETDKNGSNENGINYTLTMTITSTSNGYKRLGYVVKDNTNNTVIDADNDYLEIPDNQGGITDRQRSNLLSTILKNKLAKDLRSDLEAPQGGKKVWFEIPDNTHRKNTYVGSNGKLNWTLFSNYLNNKLDNLNLNNANVFGTSNEKFIEAWWNGCNKNQIYRTELYAQNGNKPAHAYVSKSYNTNAAYTAIANAAPYYDITTARWSVVGTDNKNLGTLSLPNKTTKSTNTITVDMTNKDSYKVTISETNPGRGYIREDTNSYKQTTLTPGNTSYVSFTNNPVYDPGRLVLQKAVKTSTNTTSTSATMPLQGAIYKITYKPLLVNGTSVGSVSRTWYYATNANGKIAIRTDKTASGYTSSALFVNPKNNNNYVWPVGDYTITEEKAPIGYVKSSDTFVVKVRENGGNVSLTATKNGAATTTLSATNALTTPEDVVSAKFTATKTNVLSSTFENSGNSKLNIAKYTLFVDYSKLSTAQRNTLFTPDVGNSKKLTISSTAETWNGNSNLHAVLYDGKRVVMSPDATGKMTTDMYLPYAPANTYVICETSAATGFAIDPVNHSIDFGNVANHGTVSAGNSTEYPLYDGFALYKKDAENESAQGDSTLNGIKFVVVNNSDSWVRVNEHMNELVGFTAAQVKLRNDGQTSTPRVNKGEVVAILTSHTHNDQEGYIGMAGLPYGKYTVYEINNSYNVKIGDKYSSANDGKSANNSYIFKPFSKAYDFTEQVWPTNLHSTEANYRTYMSTSATAANKNNAQLAISNAGIAAHTTTYSSAENPNNFVYRDGLSLIKKDDFYDDGSYNGNADFNDIKFAVINRSTHGVVLLNKYNTIEKSKVDISNVKLIEPNQIAAIITTHDVTVDGKAIHGYAAMYGLPYGKYEVVELRRDNKYVVGDVYNTSNTAKNGSSIYANSTYFWANNTHTFILHDGKDHASAAAAVAAHSNVMVISNKATIDGFAIYKKDVTFDKNNIKHEQGDASFNGIKFAVVNESDNHVILDINDVKQTPNYSANNITIADGKSIAPNHVVAIVTTHTNNHMSGYAAMYGLPYGKYRLYELRKDSTIAVDSTVDQIKADNKKSIYANDSYLLDADQTIALDLTDRETATSDLHPTTAAGCIEKHTIDKAFTNTVVSADITITKFDAETGLTGEDGNQGINTFAGIRYAIVNSSKQSMVYPANSTKPKDEYAVGQIVTVVTLDKTGTTTVKDLAYGTYTIYELRMDSTFKAHDVYSATSKKAGTSEFANAYYIYCDSNRKVTLNETARKPDHQAKFTYTVDPKTQSVRFEDENYDENYNNLPVRGDFNTIKVDIDGRYMSNIPFLVSLVETDKDGKVIFDEETGAPKNVIEEHIIVTNNEGKLDTSDWITRPKTKNNVNKLDGKYNNKGWFTGTDTELTAAQTQNIWFGRISETHDEYVRNGRGSMLYGTYYVQELKTPATKQYDMITATITINENAVTVYPNDSEILINIPYFIESVAMDTVTKTNAMRLSKESTVKDTVTFMNLKKNNKYAYKSKVYRVDKTGTSYLLKTTDLKTISPAGYGDLNYTPKTVDVNEITFNSTTLQKGEKITIVTELYKIVGKNWVLQFDHNTELTDDNETVVVPEIKTKAVNTTTRTRVGSLTPYTIPDDKIEYWNFASNHPYVIDFKIVDDKGNLVKDINGKNCTTSIQFYADAEATEVKESSRYAIAGTEFVTFRGPSKHGVFNFSDLKLNNSFEVANDYKNIYFVTEVHDTAINDATNNIITSDNTARDVEDETIRYLQIGTVASSADYLEGIIPNAKVVDLIDKINYENLAENIKVRVDGTVVEKESKDVVTTASKEFNLTGKKGTRELKFTFDSTPYAGKDLVVFEKIYMVVNGKDVLIADHSDINDTKQTVNVPDIKTNLVNVHKGTGYKVVSQVVEDITLEDTVTYKNVLPGKSWTLKATLMDKNTNAPVKDANGKVVTGTITFTPETENGSIVVPITFKQVITAQDWEIDESWVCFETLKSNENGHKELEYAVHNDIKDKDQTIYKPKFRTTATAENGSKQILAKPDQKIVDKVELKNFDKAVKTGDTFTLLIEAMDAKTGKKLLKADGTPYTNTKTFVWNGQTEENIDIVIDASKLEGKVITFFETLYFGNEVAEGSEVLRENAIDNAEQSITVPMVRTTAVDSETRTKTVSLKRLLVDKINLTYITPDTDYVIYTKLVDKATGEFIKTTDGEDLVVRSTYHSPKDSKGAIACDGCSMHTDRKVIAVNDTINVDIDVSKIADLEGKDLVVYEYLRLVTDYDEETGNTTEEEYANHEDINDKGQTVEIPKIGTTATSVDTKEHVVPVNEEIELVDVVEYSNLIKGETYTVRGKLYNKETGEPITIDDKEIIASTTFTAEAEEGTVEIKFTFNSKILEGTTLVAFEDCSWNNIDIATHSDIEDEGQTVDIPKLKTTFFDVVNNKSIKEGTENSARIGKDVTLVDIVNYTNLTPGLEYTVTGTIMDKATGEALTIDGKEITASTTFTPENKTGSVEVTFEHIDTSALAGKTVVAFEDLDYNGIDITIHANLEDKDQTIKFPEIHTELIDDNTNDHMVSEGEVTVTDIISYKNLVPGKTYKLIGSLVFATENNLLPKVSDNPPVRPEEDTTNDIVENTNNTEEDTTDVEPVVVPKVYNYEYETAPEAVMYNDQPVIGELEFVASETGEGEVKIQFTFDSSVIKNRTIVAFETLMQDETVLLVDNDIRNEDETVHVPEIHTTAKDKVDNDNVIDGTKTEQTIVDTVTYKNLVPGKTYKATGKLVVKKDYKEGEDFEYVTDKDGKIVTSVVEFTAEDYNGTVDVEFTIDASKYAGKKLVAFESVSYEDVEFATHADIEDEEQTIEVSLLLHVKVAKVDADNIKYTLKGAEITIFNEDGTIAKDINGKDCVGITDANGEVDFTVLYREDNTYYAQETKAPAGYNINKDKFEIVATDERESEGVCLIPVQIKDKIIIITPQTGDNIPVMPIAVSFGGGLACLAVFFLTRKKKSEMVEVKREEDTDK